MCFAVHEEANSDRLVAHHERFHHVCLQHLCVSHHGLGWGCDVVRDVRSRGALHRLLGVDVSKLQDHEVCQAW